jgi:hypothetical protein
VNATTTPIRATSEAIEAVGAKLLYLPPYSPDLKPHRLEAVFLPGYLGRQGRSVLQRPDSGRKRAEMPDPAHCGAAATAPSGLRGKNPKQGDCSPNPLLSPLAP